MARKRMLHPDFFTSATMNDLTVQQMLTFAGIWCWADDFGRGEDDEALVKAAVWPRRKAITESKVRSDMAALVGHGVLCSYAVSGVPLVHVVNWREHQKVSHPTKSKIAPCPTHEPDEWEKFAAGEFPEMERFARDSREIRETIRRVS